MKNLKTSKSKLSLKEYIFKGLHNVRLNLGRLCFLSVALVLLISSSVAFADSSEFYNGIRYLRTLAPKKGKKNVKKHSEKFMELSSEEHLRYIRAALQMGYYNKIHTNIVTKHRNVTENMTVHTNRGNYNLSANSLNHIIYGDYASDVSCLIGGGHTCKTFSLLEEIYNYKLQVCDENALRQDFIRDVLGGTMYGAFEYIRGGTHESRVYKYGDAKGINSLKDVFPESWFSRDSLLEIDSRRLVQIAKACIEGNKDIKNLKRNGAGNNFLYLACINGILVNTVVTSENEIISIYPIEIIQRLGSDGYKIWGVADRRGQGINVEQVPSINLEFEN